MTQRLSTKEKTIVRRLNKAALDHVVYAPLGVFMRYQAWRKNVIGIARSFPFSPSVSADLCAAFWVRINC
jgi:peptide/nickel transport system substrate-binding protein